MTTPNNPYGTPDNSSNNENQPGYPAPESPSAPQSGYQNGSGYPYPQQPDNAYQNPQNMNGQGAYTGGFENSPMNSTEKNKIAPWALGLGVASFVCMFLSIIPGVALLSPVLAIAGIIVSIISLVKGKKYVGSARRTGFSVTGLIMSILTLVLIIGFVVLVMFIAVDSGAAECFQNSNLSPADQQNCFMDALTRYTS